MPHPTHGCALVCHGGASLRGSDKRYRFTRSRRALLLLLFTLTLGAATVRADSVVVFNEIMYHPASGEPLNEWVELHNQNAVDVDLSGWRLNNGVDFTFPNGTLI